MSTIIEINDFIPDKIGQMISRMAHNARFNEFVCFHYLVRLYAIPFIIKAIFQV